MKLWFVGSVPRLIESLEFQRCELSNLALHSVTNFLPNLKGIKAFQNNIKKLSVDLGTLCTKTI